MFDQLVIGEKASYDDYEASVKERAISAPKKKTIKKTVPFSNVTHDFSKINGELYWEERELDYVFEIIAETPEEMERKKTLFFDWVMNVMDENIYDPFTPDWHYYGTFSSAEPDDEDNVEKTTINVRFLVYPYKIANDLTVHRFVVPAMSSITKTVTNESSHRITPLLISDAGLTISVGTANFGISAGESKDDVFALEPGATVLTLTNENDADCVLSIEFTREVF